MTIKRALMLIVLISLCLGISIGTVSAFDNSKYVDDLSLKDYFNVTDLMGVEDSISNDSLGKNSDSVAILNQIKESNNDENLSISDSDSSETLSLNVNSSNEILSSSVSVSSGHVYHKKGYTFKLSESQYKKIQYVKEHKYDSPDDMDNHKAWFKVKTNKYYKHKQPIYENKKVTKYKWAYKYVMTGKSYYKNGIYHYKSFYGVSSYYKKGWKYDSYASKSNSQGGYNDYAVIKKKVKYTTTKKVKTNKYKTVKKPVYVSIETHRTGNYPNMYYMVTYDFYVYGAGYIKYGGIL